MDHIRSSSCSAVSKKSSLGKSTGRRNRAKYVQTPILFSSSEDEHVDTLQNSRLNSDALKPLSTPYGHNVISKRNLFTSTNAKNFTDSDIEKVGNAEEIFHQANEQMVESVLTNSDSDDVEFIGFKRKFKGLKITDSSEDDCSVKENIDNNQAHMTKRVSIDNAVISCKTKSENDVISDSSNHATAGLNVMDVFHSPSEKQKKFQTPSSILGKKFQPVMFDSDESSSDGLESSHKLHGAKYLRKQSFLKSLSPSVPDADANEEAVLYRTGFKSRKLELTQKLFVLFNEKIFGKQLPADMTIEWNDHLLKTAGLARCRRSGGIKTCSISLSTKVVDSACRLRDTLMHEMCHAAVWIIHGMNGHGPLWQTWAVRCSIAFPEVDMPKRCHNYEIHFKYIYKCTNCAYSIGRHSKSLNREKQMCPYCNGKFYLVK